MMSSRSARRDSALRTQLAATLRDRAGGAVDVAVPATEGRFAARRIGVATSPVFVIALVLGLIKRALGRSAPELERRHVRYRVLAAGGGELREYQSDAAYTRVGDCLAVMAFSDVRFEQRNNFYVRVHVGEPKYWLETSHAKALAAILARPIPPMGQPAA